MAMLRQLAPKVVMPPSPKKTAWMNKAIERDSIAAQGPSTIGATAKPTACPVVPPGRGRLSIMITKQKADTTASKGTKRVCNRSRTFRNAIIQKGAAAA